jgi:hypothetical protein
VRGAHRFGCQGKGQIALASLFSEKLWKIVYYPSGRPSRRIVEGVRFMAISQVSMISRHSID